MVPSDQGGEKLLNWRACRINNFRIGLTRLTCFTFIEGDLFHFNRIGEEDLLEASGVGTIVEIAQLHAEHLRAKMIDVSAPGQLVR